MSKRSSNEPHAPPRSADNEPEAFRFGHTPKEYKKVGPFKKIIWRIIDEISAAL